MISIEKKRRFADSAVQETAPGPNATCGAPPPPPPPPSSYAGNNAGPRSDSLPAFANAIPSMSAGTMPASDISIGSTDSGLVDTTFDLDAIDRFLYQANNDSTFRLSDTSPFQSNFKHHIVGQTTSSSSVSRKAPSSGTTSSGSRSPSRSGENQRPPFHRRISDSDIPPAAPICDLRPSHNDDTVLDLITSARHDKGWISTLHIAAQKGHERIVRVLLLSGGLDVNKQDSDRRTPLMHAVIENHESVVRLLLSYGARLGVFDCDGRSALHFAVLYRRLGILQQFLRHRAESERNLDLDTYDDAGWTPLHMAVDRAFEAGVLMLLQAGADIHAKAHKCPYTGKIVPLMDRQQ